MFYCIILFWPLLEDYMTIGRIRMEFWNRIAENGCWLLSLPVDWTQTLCWLLLTPTVWAKMPAVRGQGIQDEDNVIYIIIYSCVFLAGLHSAQTHLCCEDRVQASVLPWAGEGGRGGGLLPAPHGHYAAVLPQEGQRPSAAVATLTHVPWPPHIHCPLPGNLTLPVFL